MEVDRNKVAVVAEKVAHQVHSDVDTIVKEIWLELPKWRMK